MSLYRSVRRGVSAYFGLNPEDQTFSLSYNHPDDAPKSVPVPPAVPLSGSYAPPPPPATIAGGGVGPYGTYPIPYYEPPALPPDAFGGAAPLPPAAPTTGAIAPPPPLPPSDLYASPFASPFKAPPLPPSEGEEEEEEEDKTKRVSMPPRAGIYAETIAEAEDRPHRASVAAPEEESHEHEHHHHHEHRAHPAVPPIEMDKLTSREARRVSAPPPMEKPDGPIRGDGGYAAPAKRAKPRGRGAGRLREDVEPAAPGPDGEKSPVKRTVSFREKRPPGSKPSDAKKSRPHHAEMPVSYKPFLTLALTMLQIGIYVFELIKTEQISKITWGNNPWQWGGVSSSTIIELGGKYTPAILNKHEFWRFWTPIFLHVSLPHIAMNLLTQLKIGSDLEKSYGATRIFIIYSICGITGNLLSCIFLYSQVQAGCSGSLFGFMGLLLVDLIQNWSMIMHPIRNLIILIISIIISLAVGLLPGVDNFAHVGGFVMGIISGFVFLPSLTPSTSKCPWRRAIAVLIATPLMLLYLIGLFVVLYKVIGEGHTADQWCSWCSQINCASQLLGEDWCKSYQNGDTGLFF